LEVGNRSRVIKRIKKFQDDINKGQRGKRQEQGTKNKDRILNKQIINHTYYATNE